MRKLVWFTVPFALAALLCVYLLPLLLGLLCALAAFFGMLTVFVFQGKRKDRKDRRKKGLIVLGGLCAGFLFCSLYGQLRMEPIRRADGQTLELSAVLCQTPTDTSYGCKAEAETVINGRRTRLLLFLDENCRGLKAGDELRLSAELRRSDRTKQGEETLYYQARGIPLIGYSRSEAEIIRADRAPLRFLPIRFSEKLYALLGKTIPEDAAGLVQALLTGDRSGMRYAQRSDLRMAGVSHMIAISGLHVSILLGFVVVLTGRRRGLSVLLGLPLVLFFVFSTGCTPSVMRAAVMQVLFLIAPLLRRENDAPTSLCAALLLLLLQNPFSIAHIGLQLSFGAMVGMLLCTGRIYRFFCDRRPFRDWRKASDEKTLRAFLQRIRSGLLRFLFASVASTLGALLLTVPLCALYFGSFSVYTVLANLVILWVVGICFAGGILTALAAFLWLPLGQALGWLLAWPVRYILWMAAQIAKLPFALLTTGSPYLVIWLVTAYLLLGLGFLRKKAILPVCGILGGLLLTLLLTRMELTPRQFQITALDVGQGQCLCLRTRDAAYVYDCGGSDGDEAGQHAAEYLLNAGVRTLDGLILSHYDEDHIGGTAQLLYRIHVRTLYLPQPEAEDPNCQALLELAAEHGIETVFVTEEMTLSREGGGLRLLPSELQGNNGSLSLLFSCFGYDMLVSGDLEEAGEALLLHDYLLPEVELYVAGHHGASHSSTAALLSAVRPQTVLISVGENRYGHPAEQTLARFAAVGAKVYRTDLCGDITIAR